MTAWRPIRGSITLLDTDLTSASDIQALFADERILGIGEVAPENPAVFEFEIAIAGRRRRAATLDESGEIIKGRSLENLAAFLHESLRKVEVTLPGVALFGPLDIGAVDIDDSSLAFDMGDSSQGSDTVENASEEIAHSDGNALEGGASEKALSGGDALGGDTFGSDVLGGEDAAGENTADLIPQGRAFALADIATSEIPVYATTHSMNLGLLRVGDLKLVLAERTPKLSSGVFPAPDYSLVFVLDDSDNSPHLIVTRMGRRMVWDWRGEMPPFEWVAASARAGGSDDDTSVQGVDGTARTGNSTGTDDMPGTVDIPSVTYATADDKALAFVRSELGAGGVARAGVADLVDVTFAAVREALLVDRACAASALVSALGLPPEVLGVLEGDASIEAIPGIKIFEPRGAAGAFTEALAWEVAGEGRVNSDVAGAFRSAYLKRPWAMAMVSACQTAVGGAILSSALRPSAGKKRSAWKAAFGFFIVANGISRIATTQYVNSAVQRFVGDVD